MRNVALLSRACVSVILASLLALVAPAYRIVDLGLPPGAEEVRATAINNRGEVLVSTPVRDTGRKDAQGVPTWESGHAYLWRAGDFVDFGEPVPSDLGDPVTCDPAALNDRSVAVGTQGTGSAVFLSGLQDHKAFLWRGKGLEDLGLGISSAAVAINTLGDVVGKNGHGAFARLGGKMRGLPAMSHVEPRDPSGEMDDVNQESAEAINDRRQILMTATHGRARKDGSLDRRAFLLDGSDSKLHSTLVPLPKGYRQAGGRALNDAGTILAVAFDRIGGKSQPYLVRRGRIVPLPFGGVLNNRDEVVGGSPLSVWRAGRVTRLPTFPGWTLQIAVGINNKGMICGTGLHDGKVRAYLLMPL